MPRTKCERNIGSDPGITFYKPAGISLRMLDEVIIPLDEYESIRLADLEGLYQEDAAAKMGISRQTFGRILKKGHHKIADAIVNGKSIRIESSTNIINH